MRAIQSELEIPRLHVMRYMGNKQRLLPQIVEAVERLAPVGGVVVDLMAGTHSVGYALKGRYRIIANDVQAYTYPIGRALLCTRGRIVSQETALRDLETHYIFNMERPQNTLFQSEYADTYFSMEQCAQLDSIRYAIENIRENADAYSLYLTALISTACLAQSSSGHFAQFMPADHPRVIPLRKIDLWVEFIKKLRDMEIASSCGENQVFVSDCSAFLELEEMREKIDLVYVDPPYSQEQYSRFYHLLETLALYDHPVVAHKAKYRMDRHKSGFSQRTRVRSEFETLFQRIRERVSCPVLLSYGSKGLLPKEELLGICRRFFSEVSVEEIPYPHSTLGKGTVPDVMELLISCSP